MTKKTIAPPTTIAATPGITPPTPPIITTVANNSNSTTKLSVEAGYQAMVAGMLAFFQATDTFPLAAGTFTRDELIAKFNQRIAAAEKCKASYQAYRIDVQAERQIDALVRPLREGVKSGLEMRFGKHGPQLRKFGIEPLKPPVKTAAVTAEAVVKGKATRTARGTKGKKQKLAIKGAPPAPTPSTEPSPPLPAPAAPVTPKS